jgi:hypothetical protein
MFARINPFAVDVSFNPGVYDQAVSQGVVAVLLANVPRLLSLA